VEVAPVDEGDADGYVAERLRSVKAAEAAADYDDLVRWLHAERDLAEPVTKPVPRATRALYFCTPRVPHKALAIKWSQAVRPPSE
jgi:hypothetical protein